MFSSRLDWDLRPNRIAALLAEKRRAGAVILDLTESNPTRAGLSYPDILGALNDPRSLIYEPASAGLEEARAAVASCANVSPHRILLTASTSEAYGYLFKLLANPGDEVLVPRPSYPLFDFLARLESVRTIHYPLAYQGTWRVDFEALEAALTPLAKAIVLVNPNNPTGSFLKADELPRLVELAVTHGLAIISDEVFTDYAFTSAGVRTLSGVEDALTFCLGGLSKLTGLPQMKLGWILTAGPEPLRQQAFDRLELIADTYLSVSTPIQNAAARWLSAGVRVREQIAARTRDNLDLLRQAIPGSVFDVLDVEGGWYATLRVPRTKTEEDWAIDLLARDNVLVQPGYFYDFETEAYLVLSLLTPPPIFRQALSRLLA